MAGVKVKPAADYVIAAEPVVLVDPTTGAPYSATGGGGGGGGDASEATLLVVATNTDRSADVLEAMQANTSAVPVVLGQAEYEPIAASQADVVLGATGAVGDYIATLIIQPTTTSPGAVVLKDNTTTIYTWPGSASHPAHLPPVVIPLGIKSANGAWRVTTGANETVLAMGDFT